MQNLGRKCSLANELLLMSYCVIANELLRKLFVWGCGKVPTLQPWMGFYMLDMIVYFNAIIHALSFLYKASGAVHFMRSSILLLKLSSALFYIGEEE